MRVNDLIELLEYCDRRAHVSVGIATREGDVLGCPSVRFLADNGCVYLVVDQLADIDTSVRQLEGVESSGISLHDYECPQIFGKHLILLAKQDDNGEPCNLADAASS